MIFAILKLTVIIGANPTKKELLHYGNEYSDDVISTYC